MNRLAITYEERQRLITQGVIQQAPDRDAPRVGRPRKSSFADEKPVCKARGCFNYVEHRGDALCPACQRKR